ncbi:hypothetical protein [Sinorhizobium sp. M4_45]|uniref:hypothetical protein n=1 Tax=Sinorhizobium sp. M4_45 TaxID=2037901 RepID=UPI000C9C54D3|nr:hypothetical protein [Sinorhizobium sp. M4_45]PND27851.1 hypothetical protein CN933_06975 [Sinorhizobium sp. M4_45]
MENPYWHEFYKPHTIDFNEVRDLCFRSFAILGASHSLMGLPGEEIGGPLHGLFFKQAESRLTSHFLDLAVKMRTFEDILATNEMKDEYDAHIKASFDADQFGSIGNGDIRADRVDLSFREACNKIIHAEDIRYVYDNGSHGREEDYAWGMEGTMELKGKLRNKDWDVWLRAEEFLSACLEIADHFDPPAAIVEP